MVKVWPGSVDARGLTAQIEVQRRLAARGFPAPTVLTPVAALGSGSAVSMVDDRSGQPTDATRAAVRRTMAAGLARLIAEADESRSLAGLPRRRLPTVSDIWPTPHNVLFDFAATRAGAEWIDAIGGGALATLRSRPGRLVVGHTDWSARNMRMDEGRIAAVYDWDSVMLASEAVVVGTAAAHFARTWEPAGLPTPSPAESTAFVRDYEDARGQAFSASEVEAVAAGVTYARAYNARCEHAIDAPWPGLSRESLATHGAFRLRG